MRDHGLRLDPQLTLALKAMGQASAFFTPLTPPDRTFTAAALEAVRELAEDAITEEAIVEAAKRESTKIAGQAIKEAPDYVKGLLSWRDQIKRGKFTLYLDTSSLDNQVASLRSIASTIVVAVLVAGGHDRLGHRRDGLRQPGQQGAPERRERRVLRSLSVAAVLVYIFLARLIREDKASKKRPYDR